MNVITLAVRVDASGPARPPSHGRVHTPLVSSLQRRAYQHGRRRMGLRLSKVPSETHQFTTNEIIPCLLCLISPDEFCELMVSRKERRQMSIPTDFLF